MLVAVSAHATNVELDSGQLRFPPIGGEWFHWRGIAKSQRSELPVGPEAAAVEVARLTGKRVLQVPELILASRPQASPTEPLWRVTIENEAAVELRTGGNARKVRELYAGYRPRQEASTIDVAAEDQPSGYGFRYRTDVVLGQPLPANASYAEGFAARDPSLPINYDLVTSITQARGE